MNISKIEKEEIVHLQFPNKDVLCNEEQKSTRFQNLIKGSILGNTHKSKCKIVFESNQGQQYVETTIWAVTDKYICLKGGISLMIASIIEVII
jgi:hypothetical protein